jgi:hypothetical protein
MPLINTFECRLNFRPFSMDGLFSLGHLFPGSAFNVGDVWNLRAGYLEYIVGFYDNIPVIDEAVVLVTITFLLLTTDEIEVEMGPTPVPVIPDQMAFQSVQGNLRVMHPVSGSHDAPVFLFNGEAVAAENESFGSVKALFR